MEFIRGSLGEIEAALGAHELKFDKLNTAAWSVAGTLGLLAVSIIAYLFVQVWPPDERAAADPAASAGQPIAVASPPN